MKTGQKKSRGIQEDTNFNKKGNQGGKAEWMRENRIGNPYIE